MKKNMNPMGYEEILPLLIKMSFPAMLSMLIQSLYNITDSYFVAKYSEEALRATSLSFPIQIIIIGVGVGTGIGINSYISRSLGANREDLANQGMMHGLGLVFISWLVFLLFKITILPRFFSRFTTSRIVEEMGNEYLGLISAYSFIVLTQLIIEKTIQGTGHMKYPMIMQIAGALTNIVLDPIMIFGLYGFPKMGIRGAAIATLIGQAVGALLGIYFLISRSETLGLNFIKFKPSIKIIKEIYKVGFPSMLMNSVTAFVTTALNLILGKQSEVAVSILGIYMKLESFVMMPVYGLGQGILPLIGYNFGSKNKHRIKETYKYGALIALLIMIIGTFLFQVFPSKFISLFTSDPHMIKMGVIALRTISVGYVFAAIVIVNSVYFQALAMGHYSLIVTSLRQIIIIVPLSYALSFIGINYVWLSYPIAEFIAFVASMYLRKKTNDMYIENL